MTTQKPPGDPGGLKNFSFALVRDEDGKQLMVSRHLVDAYLGYVQVCRSAERDELTFGQWLNDSERSVVET